MREFGKRSENVLAFAWEHQRLAGNTDRGCFSRSTFDHPKIPGILRVIWWFRRLQVGHPRSVPFGQLAGGMPAPQFIADGSGGEIPGADAMSRVAEIFGRRAVLLPDVAFQWRDWWPAGNPPVS